LPELDFARHIAESATPWCWSHDNSKVSTRRVRRRDFFCASTLGSLLTKIGVEDVNAAAGEYDQYKREELSRDTSKEEEQPIESEFARIREFCLNSANANCFLIDKDAEPNLSNRVEELTDLRLVHKVRSRVTISGRPGKLFEAYMLDVSQYTASRKKRELEVIEFWREDSTERLRRVSLIYAPAMVGGHW